VLAAQVQVAAGFQNAKLAKKALYDLEDVLIPELDRGKDEDEFRDKAVKLMKAWDSQALVLERDPSGRPFIKRYNVNEVKGELEAFAKSLTYGKGSKRKPDPDGSFQRRRTT